MRIEILDDSWDVSFYNADACLIAIGKESNGEISSLSLAHEIAHWKLKHPPSLCPVVHVAQEIQAWRLALATSPERVMDKEMYFWAFNTYLDKCGLTKVAKQIYRKHRGKFKETSLFKKLFTKLKGE